MSKKVSSKLPPISGGDQNDLPEDQDLSPEWPGPIRKAYVAARSAWEYSETLSKNILLGPDGQTAANLANMLPDLRRRLPIWWGLVEDMSAVLMRSRGNRGPYLHPGGRLTAAKTAHHAAIDVAQRLEGYISLHGYRVEIHIEELREQGVPMEEWTHRKDFDGMFQRLRKCILEALPAEMAAIYFFTHPGIYAEWCHEAEKAAALMIAAVPDLTAGEQDILDALREASEPLFAKDIAVKAGLDHETVKKYLRPKSPLRQSGLVVKVKRGYEAAPKV